MANIIKVKTDRHYNNIEIIKQKDHALVCERVGRHSESVVKVIIPIDLLRKFLGEVDGAREAGV